MSTEMTTIGRVQVRRWPADDPARLVVLVHGYGEHIGRYAHVAQALAARGSTVVGPDHVGHGRSAGERALVESFEPVVDDLHAVVQAERDDLPVVMVGHSMGGLIAICYAQRHRADLDGLVLSGRGGRSWRTSQIARSTMPTSRSSQNSRAVPIIPPMPPGSIPPGIISVACGQLGGLRVVPRLQDAGGCGPGWQERGPAPLSPPSAVVLRPRIEGVPRCAGPWDRSAEAPSCPARLVHRRGVPGRAPAPATLRRFQAS